jgi:hypothetical protein
MPRDVPTKFAAERGPRSESRRFISVVRIRTEGTDLCLARGVRLTPRSSCEMDSAITDLTSRMTFLSAPRVRNTTPIRRSTRLRRIYGLKKWRDASIAPFEQYWRALTTSGVGDVSGRSSFGTDAAPGSDVDAVGSRLQRCFRRGSQQSDGRRHASAPSPIESKELSNRIGAVL